MLRRQFLGWMTAAGATGVGALTNASRKQGPCETVRYSVSGFTCVTCATGLETLLGRERGVIAVHATYPEGLTMVSFRSRDTSEADVRRAIESMGFQATLVSTTKG